MGKDWHDLVSQPKYKIKLEENIPVKARDGVQLWADVYRPDADGKFPALLAISPYGKDTQKFPFPTGPSDYFKGTGGIECGVPSYFVSRGYAHVIADYRGIGNSEGEYCFLGQKEQEDGYDLVEWIAKQPWCDGNVGMIGMSYFALIQYLVAALNPPHLKAIFPHDAWTDVYRHVAYHGGILHFGYLHHLPRQFNTGMTQPMSKKEFSNEQLKKKLDELKNNDDVRALPYLYVTTVHPEKNPLLVDFLLHPYDGPFYWERSAYTKFDKIKIPCFITSRWNAWYVHLPGATSAYLGIDAPKRLMIVKTKHAQGFERPWHENQDVALRWYDHWLKGIDTGIMDEPPIKLFVQGINHWRYEYEWPLARTKWTKFYLRGKGLLADTPPASNEIPANFTTKWIIPGEKCPCVKYETAPLVKDMEVTGPSALYIYASLSTEDANFIVYMKDIDVDGSETMVSKGWLKASHREIDDSKSKPYQPFHPHTKSVALIPGRIYEYAIEIRDTSYVFRAGHKVQLVIQGQDGAWEDSLISYHLTRVKDTQCTIYNTAQYKSYLILPIIPNFESVGSVCPDTSVVRHK